MFWCYVQEPTPFKLLSQVFTNLWQFVFWIRSRQAQILSPGTIEQCFPTLIILHTNLEECFPRADVTGGLHLHTVGACVWSLCVRCVWVCVCVSANSVYLSSLLLAHTPRCERYQLWNLNKQAPAVQCFERSFANGNKIYWAFHIQGVWEMRRLWNFGNFSRI